MSDEMVQEKTETAAVGSENGHAAGHSGDSAVEDTVSSTVATFGAATNEPAPAPPVAESAPAVAPLPPSSVEPASPPVAAVPEISAPNSEDVFEKEFQSFDLGSEYDQSLRQLQEGDVITGTVMRVDREGVLVDVGAKSEGIIRPNELSRDPAASANPESVVSVGDRIKVYVLEPENQDGNPILSKKRADFEQAWEKVQHSKETSETILAMVTDRVKGGLVVDLGIRGFVPASHVGNGSLKNNLDKYVGQSIPLKVIEVDKERRKVVLSNKLAVQEERESKSAETKASLTPGQIRRGVVRRLTNYGAFIDLGGIDGLLHISEMSWTRINDPKEVLREGQELDVLILKMDLENNRVSLGLRQILPDPWAAVADKYKEGDIITGAVSRLVPFGAFVQVEGGVEGIIPNTELPRSKGGKGTPPVVIGEEVQVKVIGMRPDERKMTLSMRALLPPEEREPAPHRESGPPREGNSQREGGAPRDGGAPRENSGPPRDGGGAPPREGGGGKRNRNERDRDDDNDYSRYSPGRQEEPRFTIADALAAQRRDRPRRERRNQEPEEVDYDLEDIDVDIEEVATAEAEAEPEA